ncbi:MAG TPA: alkaline phosphatase family protein [Trebonia sp.]|nr:alkaline phosphatase family protein [Trebonia sp.]
MTATRREFIAGGAALGAAGALGLGGCTPDQARTLEQATAAGAAGTSLQDIGHIVILMQENRSFDQHFGTLSGVRGFSDPTALDGGSVFSQHGYLPGKGASPQGRLRPFRLRQDPPATRGQTISDIAHTWALQHLSWNNGALDAFVTAHIDTDGPVDGPLTMGYYARADLPFYHALADAFTICDGYHCSVLGPTDPNRVMAWSGTIDPDGTAGGPVIITRGTDRVRHFGKLGWETMPERLMEAGVTWKVYSDAEGLLAFNPLPYFRAYIHPGTLKGLELAELALAQRYPDTFTEDVRTGKLPEVSWIIPPLDQCEHPASPPENGEHLVSQVLKALTSNPDVWARTVLVVTYDENGGFFDHVPPVTAPPGTEGEYLTTSPLPADAGGIAGPLGLGFRVPALVISPFARGGYRYPGVLDHTSLLRLIETRFKVEAPNISSWRRRATGDLTGALRLGPQSDQAIPRLPGTMLFGDKATIGRAVMDALSGQPAGGNPYHVPAANPQPEQEALPERPPVPGAQ